MSLGYHHDEHILEEGQAVVTIGRKGVGTVREHDVVGEHGVLLDTVRSATVTAVTPVITYALSRARLRAFVEGNPTAREWMLDEMRRRYPNLT
jgi:CRP-like cAMP-binding protein